MWAAAAGDIGIADAEGRREGAGAGEDGGGVSRTGARPPSVVARSLAVLARPDVEGVGTGSGAGTGFAARRSPLNRPAAARLAATRLEASRFGARRSVSGLGAAGSRPAPG